MPKEASKIYIRQIPIGPMMNFAYLAGPDGGDEAILIDPSWDAKALLDTARTDGRTVKAIFVTHAHFDHVNALADVVKHLGVPVYVHEAEAKEFEGDLDVRRTKEGSVVDVAGITVTCLSTPGHSPGSQCLLVDNVLFTGDTLFVEGCGRVDLEGGDPQQMLRSLERLAELPDDTIVLPGHDYGNSPTSTIGEQKRTNPYMRGEANNMF
jgi:glyoxylase-like metal-dependent hydrolase (beta-lactamase superfamily II)